MACECDATCAWMPSSGDSQTRRVSDVDRVAARIHGVPRRVSELVLLTCPKAQRCMMQPNPVASRSHGMARRVSARLEIYNLGRACTDIDHIAHSREPDSPTWQTRRDRRTSFVAQGACGTTIHHQRRANTPAATSILSRQLLDATKRGTGGAHILANGPEPKQAC